MPEHLVPLPPLVAVVAAAVFPVGVPLARLLSLRQQTDHAEQVVLLLLVSGARPLELDGAGAAGPGVRPREAAVGHEAVGGHERLQVGAVLVLGRARRPVQAGAQVAVLAPRPVVHVVGLVVAEARVHAALVVEQPLVELRLAAAGRLLRQSQGDLLRHVALATRQFAALVGRRVGDGALPLPVAARQRKPVRVRLMLLIRSNVLEFAFPKI